MDNNVIDINELLMLSDESHNTREELKTKLHKEAIDICANLEGQLNTAFREAAKDGKDGFFGFVTTSNSPRNNSDSETIQAFVDKFPTEAYGIYVLEEALTKFLRNKKLIVSLVKITLRHTPINLKMTTEVRIELGVRWRDVSNNDYQVSVKLL